MMMLASRLALLCLLMVDMGAELKVNGCVSFMKVITELRKRIAIQNDLCLNHGLGRGFPDSPV